MTARVPRHLAVGRDPGMDDSRGQESLFPALDAGRFLVDEDIRALVQEKKLIEPAHFDENSLQGCTYDVRIGDKALLGGRGQEVDLTDTVLEIAPGAYAGVISMEKVTLPKNVFATLGAKRKFSYDGLVLLSGSHVDPGYSGHLLFGIFNGSPKRRFLRRLEKIVSLTFMMTGKAPARVASADPYLSRGDFPPDFLKSLGEMEVLPYVELNRRISELEKIQSDILDLKKRYADVLEPIKNISTAVDSLTKDVTANTQQIRELTTNVTRITEGITTLRDKQIETSGRIGQYETEVRGQRVSTSILKWAVGAIWTVGLIVLGILIRKWFFEGPNPPPTP